MKNIIDGVHRFRKDIYPSMEDRFQALANGQHPEALFVTCSDSRVDPSLITQTAPGEIFVLRNAGNFVTPWGEEGGIDSAVEYAVAVLGVEHVIVCGHSSCGAVGGALNPGALDAVPSVQKWVGHAACCAEATAHLPDDARLPAAVELNVMNQLENLRTHPCVKAALDAGKLTLHGWVYDFVTGEVQDLTSKEAA